MSRRLVLFQVQSPGPVFSCMVFGELDEKATLPDEGTEGGLIVDYPVRGMEIADNQGSKVVLLPYPYLGDRKKVRFNVNVMTTFPLVLTPESDPEIFRGYDEVIQRTRASKAGLTLAGSTPSA